MSLPLWIETDDNELKTQKNIKTIKYHYHIHF